MKGIRCVTDDVPPGCSGVQELGGGCGGCTCVYVCVWREMISKNLKLISSYFRYKRFLHDLAANMSPNTLEFERMTRKSLFYWAVFKPGLQ